MPAGATKARFRCGAAAADTSGGTVSSISNAISTASRDASHTIEYDPNRSANIALITYIDGEKRYIIAPETLKVGDSIMSGENAEIKAGNALPLKNIPLGTNIYNIEMSRGKGGQLVRSAGASAVITAKEGSYCLIKLPSGEIRKIHQECYATIGEVGNKDHGLVTIGKAGRSRWLNKRPKVRGVAMNPVDHPLGGGEGKSSGGGTRVLPPVCLEGIQDEKETQDQR